ncbi:MAG TPA: hypothetical protein DCO77_05960 [Nitrospiraceae bacterium]|nr:hypothetical protein [Nitrospiraceae bacterium]
MKKIVVISLLVIITILFCGPIKRGILSILILADSVRPPEKALMATFTPDPSLKRVSVTSRGRKLRADLYGPKGKGPHPPLLLVHGADPAGKDQAQLALLAENLARAGFLVLVPDLKGLKTFRPRLSDAEDILQSYRYLTKLKQAGPGGCMMGFSYGVGPMLLAAADKRVRDTVSVVVSFGGYYDLRQVLLFSMTGHYEYGGKSGYLRPVEPFRWMILYKNLDILRSRSDQDLLRRIIEKRNRYELNDVAALAGQLGPEGKAVYAFLVNSREDRFSALYERLPDAVRKYVFRMSPARAVSYIKAYWIIAHGKEDYAIPYTESLRLANAVGDKNRVHLALLPQFTHVETAEQPQGSVYQRTILGGWRLYSVIYDLLKRSSKQ